MMLLQAGSHVAAALVPTLEFVNLTCQRSFSFCCRHKPRAGTQSPNRTATNPAQKTSLPADLSVQIHIATHPIRAFRTAATQRDPTCTLLRLIVPHLITPQSRDDIDTAELTK